MHEKKIAHRDLKPDNILVSSTYHCKLVSVVFNSFFRRTLVILKSLTKKVNLINSPNLTRKKTIEIPCSKKQRPKMVVFLGDHL